MNQEPVELCTVCIKAVSSNRVCQCFECGASCHRCCVSVAYVNRACGEWEFCYMCKVCIPEEIESKDIDLTVTKRA